MAATRTIKVLPVGPAFDGRDDHGEVFQLSDMDLLMPKLYVHMIEVFSLPRDADRQQILSKLTEGLSRTLADYPILTGTLHFDNEAKRIVVKGAPGASVALDVKEPGPGGDIDIEPFSFLDEHDFPVHLLDASQVLPPSVVGTFAVPGPDVASDGPPACALQVTFIEGGLILGLAVTHQVCDGPGCEALLTSWARYSHASFRGALATTTGAPAAIPDRAILSADRGARIPDALRDELAAKFPTFRANSEPPQPPPADAGPPVVVKTRVWHIPKSKLRQLKALASAPPPPPDAAAAAAADDDGWISTYDAVLALLWRATVRAKSPLLRPAPTAPSKAVHAVNIRGRADPPIPAGYAGVGVTLPQSRALTVADVLDDDLTTALPTLARAVRGSTRQVTASYVAELVAWAGSCDDLRWTELVMHWTLGLDCMAFDWHTMASYAAHDFGFGLPAALRWPHPRFEGFFFTLPTRTTRRRQGAGREDEAEDEGMEILFGLEESCYARFEADEELLRFAEQRGLGV